MSRTLLLLLVIATFALGAEPVRYHFGDDPHWSDPTFDDSSWPQVTDSKFPMPPFYGDGMYWIPSLI